MRISALVALLKSNFKLATAPHQPACSRAVACSLALPPMKRTRKVEPFIQAFPMGAMARVRPFARMVCCGRSTWLGKVRSIQIFGLSDIIKPPHLEFYFPDAGLDEQAIFHSLGRVGSARNCAGMRNPHSSFMSDLVAM